MSESLWNQTIIPNVICKLKLSQFYKFIFKGISLMIANTCIDIYLVDHERLSDI